MMPTVRRWPALPLLVTLAASGCGDFGSEFGIDDIHEALSHAARRGRVGRIEQIASEGVDLDQPYAYDTNGWTPLQHAIDARQVDSVRVLLEWGADPTATAGANPTPLAMANAAKNAAIVQLLINAGAVPIPKDATAQTRATPAPSRP
jgi:ankyrin repeat protein